MFSVVAKLTAFKLIRIAAQRDLPKNMGQAHKEIGQFIISRMDYADPGAVGTGRGSVVRPSASKRDVLLRVGGSHRASGPYTKMQPWGRLRVVRPGTQTPDRPHIWGTIWDNKRDIEKVYAEKVGKAMSPVFAKSRGFF